MPSVCSACVVTVRSPGAFGEVRRSSKTAENGMGASVYAAPANIGGNGRTIGPGIRILLPRPDFLKSISLKSNIYSRGGPKTASV